MTFLVAIPNGRPLLEIDGDKISLDFGTPVIMLNDQIVAVFPYDTMITLKQETRAANGKAGDSESSS
jgi:hypothetical protein